LESILVPFEHCIDPWSLPPCRVCGNRHYPFAHTFQMSLLDVAILIGDAEGARQATLCGIPPNEILSAAVGGWLTPCGYCAASWLDSAPQLTKWMSPGLGHEPLLLDSAPLLKDAATASMHAGLGHELCQAHQKYFVMLLQWMGTRGCQARIPLIKLILVYTAAVPSLVTLVPLNQVFGWEDRFLTGKFSNETSRQDPLVGANPQSAEPLQTQDAAEDAAAASGGDRDRDVADKHIVDDEQDDEDTKKALRSSLDVPVPLNQHGVILFRIARKARNPMVDTMLLDPLGELSHLHARVLSAGCDVKPPWSPLKVLFVPCTEQQILELMNCDFDLEGDRHGLALQSDLGAIDAALRRNIPKKHRGPLKGPKLRGELPLVTCSTSALGQASLASTEGATASSSIEISPPAPEGPSCDHEQQLQDLDDNGDEPVVSIEYAWSSTDSNVGFPTWPGHSHAGISP